MFGKRIKLFTLLGFKVQVDLSWLVLGLLITWTLAKGVFPHSFLGLPQSTYWWMGLAGALGLFVSIVFHELCHSLVARKFGIQMRGITLFIFGGVAEMHEEPSSPKAELWMSVAGPISSVFLSGLLWASGRIASAAGFSGPTLGVVRYLSYLNLILAAFNLVPAFPLDGGRVLRSILWKWKGSIQWATRVAGRIGGFFGFALIFAGVFSFFAGNPIGGLWYFMIGLFLRSASNTSYQQILIRKALEGEKVRNLMVSKPITVSPGISLADLVEDYIYKYHYKLFPVTDKGRLIGCVTINQVKEVPVKERKRIAIADILKACSNDNSIDPDDDATKALSLMGRTNSSRLMVVKNNKLLGVITLKDMLKFFSLKLDLS